MSVHNLTKKDKCTGALCNGGTVGWGVAFSMQGPEFNSRWHHILVSTSLLSLWLWLSFNTHKMKHWSGLSLRAWGQGSPPATMIVVLGFFHRKIEGKLNQEKSLAVSLPIYLMVFTQQLEMLVMTLIDGGGGGGGGGRKIKWAYCQPQVYQLLLSWVIDIKIWLLYLYTYNFTTFIRWQNLPSIRIVIILT